MIEYHLRKMFQPLFNFVGIFFSNISPNSITAAAFITGIAAAICIACDYWIGALFFLALSGISDVLDGTVARLTYQATPCGAYIDLISDRMVECAIIFGFTFRYPQHHIAYLFFLTALLLHFSTFVAAGALFKNKGEKSMHYDHSLIERAEAFIIFGIMILFPHYLFATLISFSMTIFADAIARFIRVISSR